MSRHRPLPKPSQATLDAQAAAAARAARAGGVHADIGQVWTRRTDGAQMTIAGMRTSSWALLAAPAHPGAEPDVIWVGFDELVDEWTFTGCDHDAACCDTHGTHLTPHQGCILR